MCVCVCVCVCVYFSCLEEMRKAHTLSKQRVGPRKSPFFFLVWRVLGAFYSPGMIYEVAALVGPPP